MAEKLNGKRTDKKLDFNMQLKQACRLSYANDLIEKHLLARNTSCFENSIYLVYVNTF